MMFLFDFNRTLKAPVGAPLQRVAAVGSFLRLTYSIEAKGGHVEIEVYLNDQGREVIRTAKAVEYKQEKENVDSNQNSDR